MDLFKEQAPSPINGDLRLLCIASFDSKKGLDTLLDAVLLKSQSVPFHLRVYGKGPMRDALANQIARLDLKQHVKLGNPIPQEEVAKELVDAMFSSCLAERIRRPEISTVSRRSSWKRWRLGGP
jgi:glycosyltransferase involved in cell wall biosynthesis